jgi:magnesium transporter
MIYYAPRYGSKHVHVHILICSLLGAFTVTACKGLSVGLKEIFTRTHTYSMWLTSTCFIVIIVCILIQMVYLNRALDVFATPIVTTVYYVLFTTCVLVTSGILFREWSQLALVDIAGCLVGFTITTCGLILINYVKTNVPLTSPQSINNDSTSIDVVLTSNKNDRLSLLILD